MGNEEGVVFLENVLLCITSLVPKSLNLLWRDLLELTMLVRDNILKNNKRAYHCSVPRPLTVLDCLDLHVTYTRHAVFLKPTSIYFL